MTDLSRLLAEARESCGAIDYGENPGELGYDWCAKKQFDCGGFAVSESVP